MFGWIALAVLAAAGVCVVVRLLRSWGVAFRRYGSRPAPPGDERPLDRPFRIDPFVADDGGRASDERRILEYQELRVEDSREVGPGEAGNAPADLVELLVRPLPGPLECGQLPRDAVRLDGKPDDLGPLDGAYRAAA